KLRETEAGERKSTDTDEQFFYKTRKKALGGMKKELWSLPPAVRAAIGRALEDKFTFLLKQLSAGGTRALAEKWAPYVEGSFASAAHAGGAGKGPEDVTGLSD